MQARSVGRAFHFERQVPFQTNQATEGLSTLSTIDTRHARQPARPCCHYHPWTWRTGVAGLPGCPVSYAASHYTLLLYLLLLLYSLLIYLLLYLYCYTTIPPHKQYSRLMCGVGVYGVVCMLGTSSIQVSTQCYLHAWQYWLHC